MKTNTCSGDLSDVSAKKEALQPIAVTNRYIGYDKLIYYGIKVYEHNHNFMRFRRFFHQWLQIPLHRGMGLLLGSFSEGAV